MTKLKMLLQEAEAWAHEVEDDHGETTGTKLFRRLIGALCVMRSACSHYRPHDGDIRRAWNDALSTVMNSVENSLEISPSVRRGNPSQAAQLRKLEVWCDLMGLDIQRVVSLLGTTALAGYYDSVHSTKKPDDGTVILNRAEIAVMLEQEAQTRFGRSADMVLAEYRDGRLDFSGKVAEARGLLVIASLLPKDDPLHVDL